MKLRAKQNGFTVVEVVIIIAIVGALAFVGYKVFMSQKSSDKATTTTSTQQNTPAISEKEDLSKAADQLKNVDTSTEQDESALKQLVQ